MRLTILFIGIQLLLSSKSFCQKVEIDNDLIQKVEKAIVALNVPQPTHGDPVAVNAELVWSKNKKQIGIIIKVSILEGWHVYSYVPETEPYLEAKIVEEIPEKFAAVSDWKTPNSFPYEDQILVYKGDMVFTRYFSVNNSDANDKLSVGLFYQSCDINQCLQPKTKKILLKI